MNDKNTMDSEYFDEVTDLLEFAFFVDEKTDISSLEAFFIKYPRQAEPYYLLALAAYRLADIPRAIVLAEKAHEIDPETREYCDALACLKTFIGQLQDGLYYAKLATTCEHHQHVFGMLPNEFKNYLKALLIASPSQHYMLALREYNLLNFENSLDECQKELIINPHNDACLYLKMENELKLGQYTALEGTFKSAKNFLTKQSLSKFRLLKGTADFEIGAIEDGIKNYQQVVEESELNQEKLIELLNGILKYVQHLPAKYAAIRTSFFELLKQALKDQFNLSRPPERSIEDRRISIGFISDQLYSCDDGFIALDMISSHNREKFRICVYQSNIREDYLTQQLQSHADSWVRIHDIDNDVLDLILKNDELDILIDLTGFSPSRRSINLARHPATLQIGWYKYNHKTNMSDLDYYIGAEGTATIDDHQIPGTTINFPPGPFPANIPPFMKPHTQSAYQRNGYVTFASEISPSKLTNNHIQVWKTALNTLPDSRLVLTTSKNISEQFSSRINSFLEMTGLRERTTLQYLSTDQMELHDFLGTIDINLGIYDLERPLTVVYGAACAIPLVSYRGVKRHEKIAAGLNHSFARKEWIAKETQDIADILNEIAKDITVFEDVRTSFAQDVTDQIMMHPHLYTTVVEELYLNLLNNSV